MTHETETEVRDRKESLKSSSSGDEEAPAPSTSNSSIINPNEKKGPSYSSDLSYGTIGGVTYSWQKLNVFAENRNFFGKNTSEKHILKDVSGVCKSGQLLAIMGASGAGKTTLLNVLTYRSINLKIEGDVRINGQKADPDTLMGISAYVQQVDLFTRVFTVREQLSFHAQLRIGKKVSESERKKRIEQVIRDLGMTKCSDTLIGEPGRVKGISGGEKKRLAFACEMITNPPLLLCDEPTSGLDSFMAQSVMAAMKDMTKRGKTVISTIHQPSSEVFAMFDRLLLLAEGRAAFLGTVEEAHKFFNRLERPCPDNFNPGDHFIYTLATRAASEDQDRQFVHKVCDEFRDKEGQKLEQLVEEAKVPPPDNALSNLQFTKSPYRATYANQFAAVFRRAVMEIVREPSITAVKIIQTMFFALVFGLIYLDQNPNELTGVQNITACLFIFITNLSFSIIFPVVTIFSGEMPLFLREHWNGLYRSDVYFLTRNLVEFPIYVIIPIGFNLITYYMVGLRPQVEYFFIATGIEILIAATSVSYGYMISCIANDYNTALVLSTPLTFPLMLFAGFYMKQDTIPVYLRWMQYLSWFNYGFEALCINQWEGYVANTTEAVDVPIGDYALGRLGFEADDMAFDIWAIFGLAIMYRILAYLMLLLKTIRKT